MDGRSCGLGGVPAVASHGTSSIDNHGANPPPEKQSALDGADESAEPEVTVLNLTILAPGRPDLVLPIPFAAPADDRGHAAFVLKDGSPYSFRFSFTVANNIVSGLKYSHTVWKTGVRVENQKVMLGTFGPRQEPYTYDAEEDITPSGIFARGSYSAKLKFVDDDGKVYLDMRYCFEIRKDWGGVA